MEMLKIRTEPLTALDRLAIGIATAAGVGFIPKAPGTAGSVVGVLLYVLIQWLELSAYYPHVIIFVLITGTWASSRVEYLYGHDSQRIVIDEVAGQMITFAWAAGKFHLPVFDIAAGFLLFRLFDIVKPFPLRRLEACRGGLGVVADDVGAGLYAMLALALIRYGLGA